MFNITSIFSLFFFLLLPAFCSLPEKVIVASRNFSIADTLLDSDILMSRLAEYKLCLDQFTAVQ